MFLSKQIENQARKTKCCKDRRKLQLRFYLIVLDVQRDTLKVGENIFTKSCLDLH